MHFSRKLALLLAICLTNVAIGRADSHITYLDDDAEQGNYDIIATIHSLPLELILAEQPSGNGYHLQLTSGSVELWMKSDKLHKTLAKNHRPIESGPILIQRRGPIWRVIVNARVVLEAEDGRWHEGKLGYRGDLGDAYMQPVEDVYFDDDFMRVAKAVALAGTKEDPRKGVRIADVKSAESTWHAVRGAWSTTGISENEQAEVAQSANAFAFKSEAAGANVALAGRNFWDDYAMEASVKPMGASAVGLVIYAQNSNNYLLLKWAATGTIQLIAVANGQPTVCAEAQYPCDQKQWYRLRFVASRGLMRASVDDTELLVAHTDLFGRGQIGVYSENPTKEEDAVFDDVHVRSLPIFEDTFSGSELATRWSDVKGAWKIAHGASPSGAATASALMGDRDWKNYGVQAQIALPAGAVAGLLLHSTGKGGYLLRIAGSKSAQSGAAYAEIIALPADKVLGKVDIGSRYDNSSALWKFTADDGYLAASVNGNRILDAFDEAAPSGLAGIYAQRGSNGAPAFNDFSVQFPLKKPTWAKVQDLYEDDRQAVTMGGWSTPEGLWTVAADDDKSAANSPANAKAPAPPKQYVHKGTFWGDYQIHFKLPTLKPDEPLEMLLAAPQTEKTKSDAELKLTLKPEPGALQISLTRIKATPTDAAKADDGGQLIGKSEIKSAAPFSGQAVEIDSNGSFLIVRLGEGDATRTALAVRVR